MKRPQFVDVCGGEIDLIEDARLRGALRQRVEVQFPADEGDIRVVCFEGWGQEPATVRRDKP